PLSFTTNDPDNPTFTFDLTCAVGVPEITVLRNGVALASGAVVRFEPGQSTVFTVRNDGTGLLELTPPVMLSGSGFTLTTDIGASELDAEETTRFEVTCDAGIRTVSAVASLENSDADENPFEISLTCAVKPDDSGQPGRSAAVT